MADLARLTELIEPEAAALGFELVRVKIMSSEAGDGAQALQIMAEDPATGQLVIEQCAALSRRVSDRLDALEEAGDDPLPGSYHLEVSSPGIDRPLTRAKDYTQWAGHEVKIALAEKLDGQRNIRGKLVGLNDGGDAAIVEDNKGKRVDVPLASVHSAKLILTDALIAATKPIDTAGVEDIVEIEEEKAED